MASYAAARPRRSAALIVILGLYVSPARHWLEQSRTAGEQTRELESLKADNHALKKRVHALRDPSAVERAPRRLGMVREGERPYVIQGLPR